MIDHIPACMIIDCNFTAVYDNCQWPEARGVSDQGTGGACESLFSDDGGVCGSGLLDRCQASAGV